MVRQTGMIAVGLDRSQAIFTVTIRANDRKHLPHALSHLFSPVGPESIDVGCAMETAEVRNFVLTLDAGECGSITAPKDAKARRTYAQRVGLGREFRRRPSLCTTSRFGKAARHYPT